MRKLDKYILVAAGISALLNIGRHSSTGNIQFNLTGLLGLVMASAINGCIFGCVAYAIFGRKSANKK